MARLATRSLTSDIENPIFSSSPRPQRHRTSETPLSAAESVGSDKENHNSRVSSRGKKRHSTGITMSANSDPDSATSKKRRKLHNRSQAQPSQAVRRRELEQRGNKQFYDPDQNPDEQRAIKKGLRNLHTRLHDSRAEYLQADSKGLVETLNEADSLYKNVKQTSVATIDSRLLVATADLSYIKIKNLTLGDSSVGLDVDDLITRCISFMKRGKDAQDVIQPLSGATASTQTQRRRREHIDEDEADDGSAMNWQYLGKNACSLYNARPCLSGFLLGPLSVQKKVRQRTQRRAREARAELAETVRPLALADEDLENKESINLTVICAQIAQLLQRTQNEGMARLEEAYALRTDDPSEAELESMMRKEGIANNGCIPLFDFCVNPKSFGQTVENMFFVSFLIKEGKVGLSFDSHGLPTLGAASPKSVAERQETQKNQAVFTIDFDIWEEIVESYGIQKSIIPHRKDEDYDDGTINTRAGNNSEPEDSDAYI